MNKVRFILGVHNHQPIGNFGFVFEKAYQQAYLPFLEAMERHPSIHWNLHATGILWEWLEHNHPDYVDRIGVQVRSGQVEILTGGYYEPILPALPDIDKSGQIQKLTAYIQKRFEKVPRGLWLAERVWEPSLAKILKENGIEYTLLDDAHFFTTGLGPEAMSGSYLTEEQGATMRILPIRQDLRYTIPFKDPGETLSLLRQFVTPGGHHALTMFDDGEKFGLWPGTQEHVYANGWLEQFLTVLESSSDWIETTRISDYLDQTTPIGRVYLPTASYQEMSEWTLPAPAQERLSGLAHASDETTCRGIVRGGFWRNFLTKYEESNNLHKKMLRVSEKVHQAIAKLDKNGQKATDLAQNMRNSLWAGQCNCAYWHGVFGGLYLPHLRQALYRHLIEAETSADSVLFGTDASVRVEQIDFDRDGQSEILLETPEQNLYLSPHRGGALFEWDYKKQGMNLLNVLTRRPEGYHRQLEAAVASGEAVLAGTEAPSSGVKTIHDIVRVKERDLEKQLQSDWYRRSSLLDHFLHPDTTLDQFARCRYGEQGDFVNTAYRVDIVGTRYPQIRLSRTGTVWSGDQRNTIAIEKTFSLFGAQGWQVVYRLQNIIGPTCDLWFGSEMAFAFGVPESPEARALESQPVWVRRDHSLGMQMKVEWDVPTDVWDVPLNTVALSEEGFEKTYQGTVLLAHHKLSLQPNQSWVRSWRVAVKPL